MKSIKRILSLMLLVLFPVCLVAQGQSHGDQLYSEAIALMEKRTTSTLNKAITTFQSAKRAYESSSNKSKCDAKIAECKKLLKKGDQKPNDSNSAKRREANQYYNYAVEEQQKGDVAVALQYFTRAKETYPATDKEAIAKCEAGIQECSNPLKFEHETLRIGSQGDNKEVAVISRLMGNWMMRQVDADWIRPSMTSNGLMIEVDENTTSQKRECKVTITHGGDKHTADLNVVQYGSIAYKIEDSDESFLKFKNKDKNQIIYEIQAPDNAQWEFMRDSTDAWIFVAQVENKLSVTVEKYNGKEGRTGRIGLKYETDGVQNVTYIPVLQGTKLISSISNGMKKGWKSFTNLFTGK